MSQINVNKVFSPTQAGIPGPNIDIASNGNMSMDTDTVFVDSTNDRLGIGTTSPSRTLDIQHIGGVAFNAGLIFEDCTISGTAMNGTVNHDVETANAGYYSSVSGNWTYNIRWDSGTSLDSKMSTGETINVTYTVPVTGSSYYQSGFQIDGASRTVQWVDLLPPVQGGGRESGDDPATTGFDCYSFSINKYSGNAFYVLGSHTHFGAY